MFEKKVSYIKSDTKLPQYIPIPISLVGSELTSTATLLYGELLGRTTLSQKNGMVDEEGNVYVIYPINQLSIALGISESQVKKLMKELVAAGLLVKKREGYDKPNHLYVILPTDKKVAERGEHKSNYSSSRNNTSEVSQSGSMTGHKVATNYYSKTIDENTYTYEEGESL
jgi:DNA-binding MarR family transcriptional regulator